MTEPDVVSDVAGIGEPMTAVAAVRAAEEALRQAAHSSDPSGGPVDGITSAADAYTVLGGLGYALELFPQLLAQVGDWLDRQGGALRTDDGDAAERVAAMRAEVGPATEALAVARDRVAAAQAALAPVYGPVDG
jgi:hypothetical protein